MQSRFTKKAQEALDHASEAAVMLGHSYIGSEHLWLIRGCTTILSILVSIKVIKSFTFPVKSD